MSAQFWSNDLLRQEGDRLALQEEALATPQETVLAFTQVSKTRGAQIHQLTFSLAPGQLACVVGPSGAGKSTLLRLAAGLDRPDHGQISLHGTCVASQTTFVPPEKRHVGYVPQDYGLFPHLNVLANVAFGVIGSKHAKRDRARYLLELVGLDALAHAYPHQLSGGQQQRAALARALAPHPKLVLLDEPFSGLDLRTRAEVRDATLHILKKNHTSCLLVSHDPTEAMLFAQKLFVMAQGRIIQEGTPLTLYRYPKGRHVAELFGEVNTLCVRLQDLNHDRGLALPFVDAPWIGSLALSLHLTRHAIVCQARYPYDLPPPLMEGAPYLVVVRPEAIRLVPAAKAAPAQPSFTVMVMREVADRVFLHLTSMAQALHIHAIVPKDQFNPKEAPFALTVAAQDLLIFPCKDEAEFAAHQSAHVHFA